MYILALTLKRCAVCPEIFPLIYLIGKDFFYAALTDWFFFHERNNYYLWFRNVVVSSEVNIN
jgi:hypothetical protein